VREYAAMYTRVSSPGQATRDAASLDAQEQIARGLADQDGREVSEHYQDAGKSATKDDLDNRPAMRRLLADAAAGRFKHLYCYHEDRLARNVEVAAVIAANLRRAGVTIHTQRGPVDLDRFGGKLLYYVNGLLAEEEARRIRERCDNGRRTYAKRGDFVYWQEPFGYKWISGDLRKGIPNRLEAIPEELETLRLIYDLATKKGLTIRKITTTLDERHIPTRGGGKWYPGDVADVMRDPRYMGRWRVWAEDGEEWFARQDLIPEVAISEKHWQQAQKARAHHRTRTRRPMKHHFLLNGHLICATCGAPMAGQVIHENPDGTPALRYYVCSKKKANEGKSCRARYVPAECLEAEAMALLVELAEDPHMARTYAYATRQKALPGVVEEKERLERAIAGCDREVETLLGKLAKEVVTDEDFRLARRRLDADRAAWQERLAEIAPLIADAELSARAVEAVADTLSGVNVEHLDLQQLRWLLAQLDFVMTLACDDWRAKSACRKYAVEIKWAGQALLGESATRDYVGSPNALAIYTAI
jgi:DNA invertase Pin-like site-specific DNA recombinase